MKRRSDILLLLGFAGLSLWLVGDTLWGGFIMDDWGYITQNPWVTQVSSPWRYWTTLSQVDYWPLSYTFYWIFYRLFATDPLGYHLTNVLMHALNAYMVVRLARRFGVRSAWLAGLLFLVHPLGVQAVAWIFQFKTLLATFLVLLSLECYAESLNRRAFYWVSFLLFALSLLAKSSTLFFPLLLALPFFSFSWRKRTVGLLPFYFLLLAAGSVTLWFSAAQNVPTVLPELGLRPLLSGRLLGFYLLKFIWPEPLSFIYPITVSVGYVWNFLSWAGLALTAFVVLRLRSKWFFAGAVILLLPCLGIVNIPSMRLSLVSDHWAYLAMVFLILFTVMSLEEIAPAKAVVGVGLTATVVLALLFSRHAKTFLNEETFWIQAQRVSPGSPDAYYNLGTVYDKAGRLDQARSQYRQTVERNPAHARAWLNLGLDLFASKDFASAQVPLENAVALQPHFIAPYLRLAEIHWKDGRPEKAIAVLTRGLDSNPGSAEIQKSLRELTGHDRQVHGP